MVMPSETSNSWYERLEAWMTYNRDISYRYHGSGRDAVVHPRFQSPWREWALLSVSARVNFDSTPGTRFPLLEQVADSDAADYQAFPVEAGKRVISPYFQLPGMDAGTNRTLLWGTGFDSDNWTRTKISEPVWMPIDDPVYWRVRNGGTVGTNDLITVVFRFRLR